MHCVTKIDRRWTLVPASLSLLFAGCVGLQEVPVVDRDRPISGIDAPREVCELPTQLVSVHTAAPPSLAAPPSSAAVLPDAFPTTPFSLDPFEPSFRSSLQSERERARIRTLAIEAGAGFLTDPDAFLLTLAGHYYVQPDIAIGPLVQFGLSDSDTWIAPTLNARKVIELGRGSAASDFAPYVEAGVGFAYREHDRRRGDVDEFGFLVDLGIGATYAIDDHTELGTGVLFDFMPREVLGDHFAFGWRILTLSARF